jgi:hypothetical protein
MKFLSVLFICQKQAISQERVHIQDNQIHNLKEINRGHDPSKCQISSPFSFVWSLCTHETTLEPVNGFSLNLVVGNWRSLCKFHVWLISNENNGHFTWRYTRDSACILPNTRIYRIGARTVSNRNFGGKWNPHHMSGNTFSPPPYVLQYSR